jgi:hypothetical protein
MQDVNVSDDLR